MQLLGEAPEVRAGGPPGQDPIAWFPNNVARNFPVNLSYIEIGSLQFQRLCVISKTDPGKLCATFGGGTRGAARTPASSDTPEQVEKL